MNYLRIRVLFILSSFLVFSNCSKSAIEEFAEIVADDLQNGPLGNDVVEQNEDIEKPESEEKEVEVETFGSLTANINGKEFKNWALDGTKYFDSGLFDPKDYEPTAKVEFLSIPQIANGDEIYIITIGAYDFDNGISTAKFILLFLVGKNFESLAVGHTYEQIFDLQYEGATAGYGLDINTSDDMEGDGTDEIDEIYIKVTAIDHNKKLISGEFNFKGKNTDTGTSFVITDGVFTDIPLIIPEK